MVYCPQPTFIFRQHAGLRGAKAIRYSGNQRATVFRKFDQRVGLKLRDSLPLGDYLSPRQPKAVGAELQREAQAKCNSTFTELARDEMSIMYERRSVGCPAGYPPVALYRLIGGKHSLFLLAVLVKDDLNETSRSQWLALMSSAHLE